MTQDKIRSFYSKGLTLYRNNQLQEEVNHENRGYQFLASVFWGKKKEIKRNQIPNHVRNMPNFTSKFGLPNQIIAAYMMQVHISMKYQTQGIEGDRICIDKNEFIAQK